MRKIIKKIPALIFILGAILGIFEYFGIGPFGNTDNSRIQINQEIGNDSDGNCQIIGNNNICNSFKPSRNLNETLLRIIDKNLPTNRNVLIRLNALSEKEPLLFAEEIKTNLLKRGWNVSGPIPTYMIPMQYGISSFWHGNNKDSGVWIIQIGKNE